MDRMSWRTAERQLPTRASVRESAKIAVRSILHRHDLDLMSNPYPRRVAAMLSWLRLHTVVDVGANVGQYGAALRASGFGGRIVSCEPLPDAYGRLVRRAAGDPSWMGVNAAVGESSGSLEINVSANSYSSSILPMAEAHRSAAPGSEYIGSVRVPVTTVADLVGDYRIQPRCALLKIDTQGFEGAVLDGARDLIGEFAAVQLELSFLPLYEGQQLFPELTVRMEAAGYTMYALGSGFGDRLTGRMLQCDGLFVLQRLLDDQPPCDSGAPARVSASLPRPSGSCPSPDVGPSPAAPRVGSYRDRTASPSGNRRGPIPLRVLRSRRHSRGDV